jgi:hypothetical protein
MAQSARPVLIDPADGPCEICESRAPGRCDRCHKPIPVYENMGGAGFQSVKPDHFHLAQIEGIAGRRAQWAEVCRECYREEHKTVYPDLRIPV